jgi:hypothetical protein
MTENERRRIDRIIQQALGAAFQTTTSTAPQPQCSLTADGLLYHMAVIMQDIEENPVAVALRACPGTVARLSSFLRAEQLAAGGPPRFDGLRIEEAPELPPYRVEFIDHRGRVLRRADIICRR